MLFTMYRPADIKLVFTTNQKDQYWIIKYYMRYLKKRRNYSTISY
jgi:hypothetical protein